MSDKKKTPHIPIFLSMPRPFALAMDDDDKEMKMENENEDGSVWVELLTTGPILQFDFWSGEYFEIEGDKKDLAKIVENFNSETNEIPYNRIHDRYSDMGEAFGWVREVELRNDGNSVYGRSDFMDETKQKIKDEKYKYVSVELGFKDLDEAESFERGNTAKHLVGVGLTNYPANRNMEAIALSMFGGQNQPVSPKEGKQKKGGINMSTKNDDGTLTLSAEEAQAYQNFQDERAGLVARAEAGDQAQVQLRQNKIDTMLEGHLQRGAIDAVEKESYLNELKGCKTDNFDSQYNLINNLLEGRPDNSKVNLQQTVGQTGTGGEDGAAGNVKQAFDNAFSEAMKNGSPRHIALQTANNAIRQQFSPQDVQAFHQQPYTPPVV